MLARKPKAIVLSGGPSSVYEPGAPAVDPSIFRSQVPVFGMPGNPTSCLTNAYVLLAPALRRMGHAPPAAIKTLTVPLGQRVTSTAGRLQFYTVRLENGTAMPAFKTSGDITSMSKADGYIEIAADVESVAQGEMVQVTLF